MIDAIFNSTIRSIPNEDDIVNVQYIMELGPQKKATSSSTRSSAAQQNGGVARTVHRCASIEALTVL